MNNSKYSGAQVEALLDKINGLPVFDCGSDTSEIPSGLHSLADGTYFLRWKNALTNEVTLIVGEKTEYYVNLPFQYLPNGIYAWDSSASKYVLNVDSTSGDGTVHYYGSDEDYISGNELPYELIRSQYYVAFSDLTSRLVDFGLIDFETIIDENTGEEHNIVRNAAQAIKHPVDLAYIDYDASNGDPDVDINRGLPAEIFNLSYLRYSFSDLFLMVLPSEGNSFVAGIYTVVDINYDGEAYDGFIVNRVHDICVLEIKTLGKQSTFIPGMYDYTLQVTEYLLFGKQKRTITHLWETPDMNPTTIFDFRNESWTDGEYFGGSSSGGGVTPPASSTDNAIVRFDGAGGDTIQNSGVLVDDDDNIILPVATVNTFASNARIEIGNAWLSSNTSGSLGYGVKSGSTYTVKIVIEATGIRPVSGTSGAVDIGTSSYRWRDIYMSGAIKDGTYTLSRPNKSGTIAVTSDIPTAITIHTGTSTPSSSLGSDGDIYIKTSS